MKFLIDNALSPLLARILESLGHDAVHVRDCGMHDAEDRKIFDYAAAKEMIIISADTDFGALKGLSVSLIKSETIEDFQARVDQATKPAMQ